MDPKHTDDLLNHFEKQHVLLLEARKIIYQEVHKLEVEEEMMMKKLYDLMCARDVHKKKMSETQNVSQGKEIVEVEASSSSSS